MGKTQTVRLTVNGASYEAVTDVRRSLLSFLRDTLGLTGTKEACAEGECEACSILLDGRLVASCLIFAVEAHGAVQCGFCIPGMLLAAQALLDQTAHPTEAEIRHAISGNLCRCTGYQKIVQAIAAAAQVLAGAVR